MVGQHGIMLATGLIKDHFGEIASKVCNNLLRRGSLSLQEIAWGTGLASSLVKNCLLVLIQHNCVQAYSIPKSGGTGTVTLYMALFDNIIHRMRFSKFLGVVADDLGSVCEVLIEGLFQHGRLTFEQILERAISKKGNTDRHHLLANFNKLVHGRYVERCPRAEPFLALNPEEEAPKRRRGDKSSLETMTSEKQALIAATLSDAERFSGINDVGSDTITEAKPTEDTVGVGKKRKHESLEMDKETEAAVVENEVYWRANSEKFVYCLKKKACVANKRARLGIDAGVVLEAMIESCEGSQLRGNSEITSSLDCIFERLVGKPQGRVMNIQHCRTILEELGCKSFMEDIMTSYTIDLQDIIKDFQNDEVEALVLRRYGREAYRIFRLLSKKNRAFEMDKISDITFVEKKDAQIVLCKLWKDNYLHMEKVASPEHRKTFFLWKVNRNSLQELFLEDMYHAASNLNQRISYNYEKEKEVVDLPIKSNEIQKKKYNNYAKRKKILENSLLKLDDVLMFFHDF